MAVGGGGAQSQLGLPLFLLTDEPWGHMGRKPVQNDFFKSDTQPLGRVEWTLWGPLRPILIRFDSLLPRLGLRRRTDIMGSVPGSEWAQNRTAMESSMGPNPAIMNSFQSDSRTFGILKRTLLGHFVPVLTRCTPMPGTGDWKLVYRQKGRRAGGGVYSSPQNGQTLPDSTSYLSSSVPMQNLVG